MSDEDEIATVDKKTRQNMASMLASIRTEKDVETITKCGVTEACFVGASEYLETFKYIWGRIRSNKKISKTFVKRTWGVDLPDSADDPKLYADQVVFATATNQADDILGVMQEEIDAAPRDKFYEAVTKARNRLRDIAKPLTEMFGGGASTKTVSYDEAGSLVKPPAQKWLVKGVVPDNWPTFFYGEGGSAKSYLAMLLALAIALGLQFLGVKAHKRKVLYLDWEMDEPTFRARVNRVAKGMGISVEKGVKGLYYKRLFFPLKDHLDEIIEECEQRGIGLVIIDSFAFSMTGQDTSAQPDVTAQMARIAQIPAPCVIIDHISKEGKGEKGPFGSAYKKNASRWMWWCRAATKEQTPDGETPPGTFVRMWNAKHNIAAQQDDIYLHVEWDDDFNADKVTMTRKKREDVPQSLTQDTFQKGSSSNGELSASQQEFLDGVAAAYDETKEPVTREAMRLFMGLKEVKPITSLAKSLTKLGLLKEVSIRTGDKGQPLRGYLLVGQVASLEDIEEDEAKI